MLENVAHILKLITEKPNERNKPRLDDLQGSYTSWFDGGAVNQYTGLTIYDFTDGSRAVAHVLGYLYITVILANGTKICVIEETSRAGEELVLIGQQLLTADEKSDRCQS